MKNRYWELAVATTAPACLAVWIVWRATASGVTFTPDAVAYLEAARSFAAEAKLWVPADCGSSRVWLSALGPFYPVLLGVGIKAGWEAFLWARILGLFCAAVTTAATALGTLKLSGSATAAALAGCAIALLPAFTDTNRAMLSEAPYLALVMVGWLLLTIGISGKRNQLVRWGALAFGLGVATRYAAFPLVITAALFVWYARRSWRLALETVAIGAAPTIAFASAAWVAGGYARPRPFSIHPPSLHVFAEIPRTLAGWIGFGGHSALWDAALVAAVFAGIGGLLRHRGGLSSGAALALALAGTHALGLIGARIFFDASLEPGLPRHLVILFALGIAALSGAVPRWLSIPAFAVLAAIHLGADSLHPAPVAAQYDSNHPDWRISESLNRIGEFGPGVCVSSNAPDLIYRRYGKPSQWLPEAAAWFTGAEQPWCYEARENLKRHPRSAFIYFDAHRGDSPNIAEEQLVACIPHLTQIPLRDGTILLPEEP